MTVQPPGTPDARDPSNQLAAAVLVQAFYTACTNRYQMGDNLTLERRQAIFEEVWRVWSETARAMATSKSAQAPKIYASSSEVASPEALEFS
jgi:hypothetical protein